MCNILQAFPDNAAKREVEALEAVCINEGCSWTGTIKEYEVRRNRPIVCERWCNFVKRDPTVMLEILLTVFTTFVRKVRTNVILTRFLSLRPSTRDSVIL